jgi:hypothetical protein
MDERRFDALARSSATAPRRRVLGGLVAVALGGFAATHDDAETLAACKGNFCKGKKQRCGGKNSHCVCYKRVDGSHVCALNNGICNNTNCASDLDCPPDTICVQSGKKCCGEQTTACAFACGVTPPPATAGRRFGAR